MSGPQVCRFPEEGGLPPTEPGGQSVLPVAPILSSRHALCPHTLVPGQLGLSTCHSSVPLAYRRVPAERQPCCVGGSCLLACAGQGGLWWRGQARGLSEPGPQLPAQGSSVCCYLIAAGYVPLPGLDKSLCSRRCPEIRASRGSLKPSQAPGSGKGSKPQCGPACPH